MKAKQQHTGLVFGLTTAVLCLAYAYTKTPEWPARQGDRTLVHPTGKQQTEKPLALFASASGTWLYGFPFFSSELILEKNGRFSYHTQGCTGHTYTAGTWIQTGQFVHASSDRQYDEPLQPDVLFKETVDWGDTQATAAIAEPADSTDPEPDSTLKLLHLKTYAPHFRPPVITLHHGWPDTSFVFWKHVVFQIEADTLFGLSERGERTTRYTRDGHCCQPGYSNPGNDSMEKIKQLISYPKPAYIR